MADIKYYDVILKPVVTEKSMNLMGEKKYTFLVHPEATKSQVKEAVEKMFSGTKVESVNTMNCEGKRKRVRGKMCIRDRIWVLDHQQRKRHYIISEIRCLKW